MHAVILTASSYSVCFIVCEAMAVGIRTVGVRRGLRGDGPFPELLSCRMIECTSSTYGCVSFHGTCPWVLRDMILQRIGAKLISSDVFGTRHISRSVQEKRFRAIDQFWNSRAELRRIRYQPTYDQNTGFRN